MAKAARYSEAALWKSNRGGRPGYTGHHQPVVRENAFMALM
jgi:hypothetical protein